MIRFRNHFLFWCTYVAFKTYLNISAGPSEIINGAETDWEQNSRLLLAQLTFLTIKIPLVYASFYLIDRYLKRNWNLAQVVASIIFLFALSVVLMTLLNHNVVLPVIFTYTRESSPSFAANSLLYHFFTLAFVAGAANSVRLLQRQYKSRVREVELNKEKTEAELKYLKSQINPHFLFNTLNNIYSLARKSSPQTADAVLKLSKLMRFMLYEASNQTILLLDELKLINDYIDLEKLRYNERLTISYAESIDTPHQRIAPLILIHFVENAFKHGASEARFDSYISINVQLKENRFSLNVVNSKAKELHADEKKPIGMENIKRQLELIYPQHTLHILDNPDKFIVDLMIPLKPIHD